MFAVCMALRLARFNAALDSGPHPAYAYNFFTGVPAPAGAGLALFPLFLGLEAQVARLGLAAAVAQYPLFVRLGADRHRAAAGLHPAGLELQELQGAGANTCCRCCSAPGLFVALLVADPWAALAGGGADLSRHAAVQRAQLPPPQARGRGDARGRSALIGGQAG